MKIIKFFICFCIFSLNCQELEEIFKTRPWTAIIPIYGDLTLKKLNHYLTHNTQQNTLLKYLNYKTKDDIKELKALPNDVIEKELNLIHQFLPYISAHRKAALLYSYITLGSLFSIMGMLWVEDRNCSGNINSCKHSIDTTIPFITFWTSAPFFFYKFLLEPEIATHEKEFAELIEKLRKF